MLDAGSGPSQMHTTAWSMIIGAQQGGEEGRASLERLCHNYWKPAYYYARRRGMDHHGASDCIQEFFARMLAGDWLGTVDKERGSFRGWLLTALRRWVSRSRTATGMDRMTLVNDDIIQSYDREDNSSSPEDLFNKAWANSCLDEALSLMEKEQKGSSKERQVAVFIDFLQRTVDEDSRPSYEVMAEKFSVPVTTITNDLHRARSLFRTYLERIVRDTLNNPSDIEQELFALRQYLGR
ncbi:MAG: sigma-70 family RNA polymerase sigma factor [Planctomycetes bacterium]|nr:sigma-70 family RNA polymerase sigma factor [Planctomycetota bacterium]